MTEAMLTAPERGWPAADAADAVLYRYRARVVSVYDGDTIRADVDLGFDQWSHNQKFRLYGIDAPEVRGEEREAGLKARDALRVWIDGREVIVETLQDRRGKYGRWLALVWLDGVGINERMVAEGHAAWADY